jgi:putative addiction module component (TIGR02574 family)
VLYFHFKDHKMSQALALPPPGFDQLTIDEQIDYLHSLWDRITAHPEQIPVPDWHREVLAERLAALDNSPSDGSAWEQFDRELTEELQSKSDSL